MGNTLKKAIAILTCFSLLASVLVAGFVTTANGADTDITVISTADQLLAAVKSSEAVDYKLANDIVINDITVKIENGVGVVYNADGTEKLDDAALAELKVWNTEMTEFGGTLDGDGHIIRGLYINDGIESASGGNDYKNGRGLINACVDGVTLKNVGLHDTYVSFENGTAAGFIANSTTDTLTFENCYVDDSAYFYGYNVGIFAGSGSRSAGTITLTNCYSQGTIGLMGTSNNTYRGGAILGDFWSSSENSFKLNGFYSTTDLFYKDFTSHTDGIYYENVSAEQGYIGTAFDGNTFLPSNAFCAAEGELPTLKVFKGLPEDVWSGIGDDSLTGAGTEEDPILISTPEQLAYVMYKNGNISETVTENEHFILTKDIYLNNVFSENWKENENNNPWYYAANSTEYKAKAFSGNIDGQGYGVYGIWIRKDTAAYSAGLVPNMSAVTIENLAIKQAQIAAASYAGGIVGYWSGANTATVSCCYIDSTVDINQNDSSKKGGAGGIVGYTAGGSETNCFVIENCSSAANCVAERQPAQRANGLVGTAWKGYYKVVNSYSLDMKPFYFDANSSYATMSYLAVKDSAINDISAAYQNVYSNVELTEDLADSNNNKAAVILDKTAMLGENALSNMSGFSGDIWYAVKNDSTAPMLRIHGTAKGDVDEDGIGLTEDDVTALRKALIGTGEAKNGNYSRDEETNISDLVALYLGNINYNLDRCEHTYKSEITTESDLDTDGIVTHTCKRCGYSYDENIGTSISLLAIGSSHTRNSITYFGDICEAAGIDNVYLGHMYKGGVTFQQQYEDATGIDTDGDGNTSHPFEFRIYESSQWSAYAENKHVADIIGTYDWDYIVINQGAIDAPMYGQTLANGDSFDSFETYFDWQVDYITSLAPNATLCWNMTFACEEYEEGDPRLELCDLKGKYQKWFNFDSETMYEAIVGAVKKYVLPTEEIDIILPASTTVQNIRSSYKGHTLTNDLTHLDSDPENLHGRYAVGLTWFKAITGADLSTLDWVPEDNLTDDLPMIREAVNNAIEKPLEETESSYKNVLDGKKIIFIGNSFTYYGKTVLEKSNTVLTQEKRSNDKGYFYQLCKENGADVEVTNWTFGGHNWSSLFETCTVNRTCKGTDHFSYLTDRNFDYVVLQHSSGESDTLVSDFQKIMGYFREANPNVKFVFLVQHQAHYQDINWLADIKALDPLGVTVVDWGKLVYDLYSNNATVPGSELEYNKNSFIVSKDEDDGYHPNMLSGYITTLMTYCALTGEKAVGQPYAFCGDTSVNAAFDFDAFKSTYYIYDDTTTDFDETSTNFADALSSENEVRGIQTLIDQYLEDKAYMDY